MKKGGLTYAIIVLTATLASCNGEPEKQEQRISMEELPTYRLKDSPIEFGATSTSGLAVSFESSDTSIVSIDGNTAILQRPGEVSIKASQDGDDDFYEAPQITRTMIVKDWDPNKKDQSITFSIPSYWKESEGGQVIKLRGKASSGLPVTYSISGPKAAYIYDDILVTYHAGESKDFKEKYEADIVVIASQPGNDEYNAADNVECPLHIVGDVYH